MRGRMSTQLGEVTIDLSVIAKYAGTLAVECFGIDGLCEHERWISETAKGR